MAVLLLSFWEERDGRLLLRVIFMSVETIFQGEQAAPCGGSEKLPAQALPLHADMRRNARKTEPRNILLYNAATKSLRRVGIYDCARS